jgi:hypothetical protein
MPKSTKKPAKKTAKKTSTKRKAAPKAKVKAAPPERGSRRGFMWKVLEQKQMKQKEQAALPHVNPEERVQRTANPNGFARFNGPRRRAA